MIANALRLRFARGCENGYSQDARSAPIIAGMTITAPSPAHIALLLGLSFFLGLAFEEYFAHTDERRPGGIRTFPMLAIAGGVLYLFDPEHFIPFTAGLLILGAWLLVYYLAHVRRAQKQEDEPNVGLVVPMLNVLAYVLGAVALAHEPWVAVTMTVAPVLLLTGREQLHGLARRIEIKEIVTAGEFLILTGVVLPLLPDHPVTTLTAITPRQVWLALVVVCFVLLCQLSGAALLGGRRRRTVDGGARRPLFVDRDDRRSGAASQSRSGAQAPGASRHHARHRDHVSAAAGGGHYLQHDAGARSGAAAVRPLARGLCHLRAAILARQAGERIGTDRDAGRRNAAIRSSSARRRSLPLYSSRSPSSRPSPNRSSAFQVSMGSPPSSVSPTSIPSSSTWRRAAFPACRLPTLRPRS